MVLPQRKDHMNSTLSLRNAKIPINDFALSVLPLRKTHSSHRGKSSAKTKSAVSKEGKAIIDEMEKSLIAVGTSQDRGAFQSLFDYFAPRVKSYLQARGASPDQAEEAVQEALLNVWRKAHQYDPEKASASTWIFAIARNARIDLVRKSIRPELDPNDPALVPDSPKAAIETVSAAQDAVRIRCRVAALPSEQQEVLKLAFFEDIPHSEIAKKLGIPLGTVKSRIRLAVQRIRSEIGEDE